MRLALGLAGCIFFALLALLCVYAALREGAMRRDWKFALGAVVMALVMLLGALDMWERGHGRGSDYDPSIPRLR